MDDYVKAKLRAIEVPKGYLSNIKCVRERMLTNIKGVDVGVGWLVGINRKTRHGSTSLDHSFSVRKSRQLISEIKAAVKQRHAVPIPITIWPLPLAELRWTTLNDSSFGTGEGLRHQQGQLVCASIK